MCVFVCVFVCVCVCGCVCVCVCVRVCVCVCLCLLPQSIVNDYVKPVNSHTKCPLASTNNIQCNSVGSVTDIVPYTLFT